jgi:urea transport system substrate-binding protein
VDPDNQHTYKYIRIGQINEAGLIDEVYSSSEPVKPDPFLKNIEWAAELSEGMSQ